MLVGSSKPKSRPARMVNIRTVQTFLLCAVLALVVNSPVGLATSSTIEGLRKTLHFPKLTDPRHDFKIVDASSALKSKFEHSVSSWVGKLRAKRAAPDEVDPNNCTTVASLGDSHTTLLVHWAGEGSDVIIALAKSTGDVSSSLFISRNYGKTFDNVSSQLMVNWTKAAVISNYYSSKAFNSYYVFTDETNNCMFTTDNSGENIVRHCNLPFTPRVLKLNPANPRLILAMDDQSLLKELYLSENFGETWRSVYTQVKAFYWGIPPYDNASAIYVEEEIPSFGGQNVGKVQILRSDSLFQYSYNTISLISDVVNFELKDDYMYATKSVNLLGSTHNPHIQLWVSYKRGPFARAEFPGGHVFTDYYVADAAEGQLMVCAYINNSYTNLYVSEVTGYKFSLSLERIVYFNPKTVNNQNWIRLYANETFADITRVHGVSGIYIASQQINDSLEVDEQRTMITYDKGGRWETIRPPVYTINNQKTNCKTLKKKNSFKENNCSLHLTQEFHRLYRGSQTSSILTQHSSPGLIVASGTVGNSLKGDPNVFVSINAGVTWRQVLSGSYFYATADHGGVILAAHQFVPTNEVIYSLDEGETFHNYKIVEEPIFVYGLLTEPGENTTVFSVFGSKLSHHSWQIIQVDFKKAFGGKKCGPSDYKMWSVNEDLPSDDGCLLGHVTNYQRRIAHAICYNGDDFVRTVEVSNCSCSREDFECDFGFEEIEEKNRLCQRDLSVKDEDVYRIPSTCRPGSFYTYTRGYRKVSGDTCSGGEEHRYGPLQYSCPIKERVQFLLVTSSEQVKMIDLTTGAQLILLNEHVSQVAPVFDYEMNCLIYVETEGNIKRKCFAENSTSSILNHEIIHRVVNGTAVTSMAFDWTGRNIYYTLQDNSSIRVVNVDNRYERTLYTSEKGVYGPSTITVDPHHGYLFFVGRVSSSSQEYAILRAAMDGSSTPVEILIRNATEDTSLTLDLDTESLYWVTPGSGSGYTSNIDGQSVSVLFNKPNYVQHPTAIAIYKNDLYVASKTGFGILTTNKHLPTMWHYFTFTMHVSSIVVVSNTSHHATSACSAFNRPCSQLCLPHPSTDNHNRTCLCGDGYKRSSLPASLDENCSCEDGEMMTVNNTCVRGSHSTSCAADKLTCHNGNCVFWSWKCDGEDDCGDSTDEIDCPFSTCGRSSFTCHSGKCIPLHWKCDHMDDCNDGFQSDEWDCANHTCSSDQFQCKNGLCISHHWLCDMDNDCHDNSDEENCASKNTSCPPWSFTCANGACIDRAYKCNGHNDCSDGSDERDCRNQTISCASEWLFDCGNGQGCINLSWYCDGEADCANGRDEQNCTTPPHAMTTTSPTGVCPFFSYTCANKFCIGWENICNGINDCGDGSDEKECSYNTTTTVMPSSMKPSYCSHNEIYCPATAHCLPDVVKCNGHEDCPDGTDEENCETCNGEEFKCAGTEMCIRKSWVCDGLGDCPDGDDELDCAHNTTQCLPSDFMCNSDGGCIPMSKRCDRSVDCYDGTDELGCYYSQGVNCSIFDNYKENCCSYPQCGMYIFGAGQCKNINESRSLGYKNDCSGFISGAYECKAGQFKCGDSRMTCVSLVQVCDHQIDCSNGQDEQNCYACPDITVGPYYTATNISVTWPLSFPFTSLSFAEVIQGQSWANLTWQNMTLSQIQSSDNKSVTVGKLRPHTAYHFVFFKQTGNVMCVHKNYDITTDDGIPSAPIDVHYAVRSESYPLIYVIDLSWRDPAQPNGDIKFFAIHYQNSGGGDIFTYKRYVRTSDLGRTLRYNATISENIQENTTYNVWITAVTSAGEGAPSDKTQIKVARALYAGFAVNASNIGNSGFTLTWTKIPSAKGYLITVHFQEYDELPAARVRDIAYTVNSTQTSFVVKDLCPGTTIVVGMQVDYGENLLSPMFKPNTSEVELGAVHLKGTQPVVTITGAELVEPTHFLLKYNLTQGEADKYFIYHTYDGNSQPASEIVTQTSYELVGLFACHRYITWIRPAYESCPYYSLQEFYTKEDIRAPPKDVQVSVMRTNSLFNLNISWGPSCSESLALEEGYIVNIKMGDQVLGDYMCSNSNRSLFMPDVQSGVNYTVTVRTAVRGAEETSPVTVFIPYLDGPYNLVAIRSDDGYITLKWEFPKIKDKEQFEVHVKGEGVEWDNYTAKFEIKQRMPKNGTYVFSVIPKDAQGHNISLPGTLKYSYDVEAASSPSSEVISISKTNLVAILVPVAVVMVGLSAGLVVFIVRHRRLQRSFLAFANSHYNIQSGTTTFSEDLDGDEPLIQGFSDDEPLVIA